MSSAPAKPTSVQNVNETTKIAKGEDNVIQHTLNFVSCCRADRCMHRQYNSLFAGRDKAIGGAFENAKNRGITLNYVTEITRENISYCKQLIQFVSELRHVDGIKGNFYVSEKEYIAPAKFHELGKSASQLIYSNVAEIVEQQQYV